MGRVTLTGSFGMGMEMVNKGICCMGIGNIGIGSKEIGSTGMERTGMVSNLGS